MKPKETTTSLSSPFSVPHSIPTSHSSSSPLSPPKHETTQTALAAATPLSTTAADGRVPLSPLRSDQPDRTKPSTASLEKYYSPLASPLPGSPTAATSHVINLGRVVAARGGERGVVEEMVVRRERKEERVRSVGVVIRVCEVVLCLISFSVLAADRTQGWSGDSFDRYKEYRFCLSINVIGVVYAGFQALDQAYHLASGKHLVMHHLRHHFDFVIDQVLAYLLISASSAAATRVVDWELNWGKDAFTEKASASVSMSFLAFIAFAISSLISGYNICNREFA